MNAQGLTVAVVGMARSGVAAIELLQRSGAVVRAVDEKLMGEIRGVPVLPQTDEAFQDVDLVVLSPGVPPDLDVLERVRQRGVPMIGELEVAACIEGPSIGITGSNGKTTTTALTGHILQESGIACQVGGNIGTPPTAMVATSRPDQWNVLELSSFQLEGTRKLPRRNRSLPERVAKSPRPPSHFRELRKCESAIVRASARGGPRGLKR